MDFTYRCWRGLDGLIRLPDVGRISLGAIVDAAEVSYFGGRPVDGGIYADCRRHYQAFAFSGSPT